MSTRTLNEVIDALASVLTTATEYTLVEDWTEFFEAPASRVDRGLAVDWLGDRNTRGAGEQDGGELEMAHRISVRLARQIIDGTHTDGRPMRVVLQRELRDTRLQVIRTLLTRDDDGLADLLITYNGSSPVTAGDPQWRAIDLEFRVVARVQLGSD